MKAHLQWTDEDRQPQRLEIRDRVFIGRVCPGIEPAKRILLSDPVVSRNHAEISVSSGHIYICDTSTNGTWVNGVRVTPGASREVLHGDVIRIGDTSFILMKPDIRTQSIQMEEEAELTRITRVQVPVTSLVADIKGFTTFSSLHDSSEVYELVNTLFSRFSTIIEDCHGTVKDYIGDAIFAFWEHSREDSLSMAVWACRAAVGQLSILTDMLQELSGRIPGVKDLTMGWGITTGEATIAHFGSRVADLALVGDSINLAFRLSSLGSRALPEPILVCEKTAPLVEKHFELIDLGPTEIKGRVKPATVFALKPPVKTPQISKGSGHKD